MAQRYGSLVIEMRYGGAMVLLLLLTQSCNLLKSSSTKTASNEYGSKTLAQTSTNNLATSQTDQHFYEWKLDSANTGITLQIWPKGKFKFSLERGFEGEAEKIVVISSLQKKGITWKSVDSSGTSLKQTKEEALLKQALDIQETTVVKELTPAFWPIVGLAVVAIAGMVIYKLLKP